MTRVSSCTRTRHSARRRSHRVRRALGPCKAPRCLARRAGGRLTLEAVSLPTGDLASRRRACWGACGRSWSPYTLSGPCDGAERAEQVGTRGGKTLQRRYPLLNFRSCCGFFRRLVFS